MTTFNKLSEIHSKVLKLFTYKTDKAQYRTEEKWVMPPDAYNGTTKIIGDCEDFALACRKLCRDAGIQSRIVVCSIDKIGHCVLESDGWILDNSQDSVLSRDQLELDGYVWHYISGFEPGDDWYMIEDTK